MNRPISWTVSTTQVENQSELEGVFRISCHSMDYRDDERSRWPLREQFRQYVSSHPVRVRQGHVDTCDLIRACDDLHQQTGYWGSFIDCLELLADGTIEVSFGS